MLKHLILHHNKIETMFNDLAYTHTQLEEVDLSYNMINSISWRDLKFLQNHIFTNLTNNKITTIDFNGFDKEAFNVTKIEPTKIYLDSNPYNCNCNSLALLRYVQNRQTTRTHLDIKLNELYCSEPQQLRHRRLIDLDPYELTCSLDSPNTQLRYCPSSCDCKVRFEDRAILINCTNANLTNVPALPYPVKLGLVHLELDVSNNFIDRLPKASENSGYNSVSLLVLNNNNLSYIDVDHLPERIKVLHLAINQLQYINRSVLDFLDKSKVFERLSLAGNQLRCDCGTVDFLNFVQTSQKMLVDLSQLTCEDGEPLAQRSPGVFCPEHRVTYILFSAILVLLGVLTICGAILYIRYSMEIKVWLCARYWGQWFTKDGVLDDHKNYDAFISCARSSVSHLQVYKTSRTEQTDNSSITKSKVMLSSYSNGSQPIEDKLVDGVSYGLNCHANTAFIINTNAKQSDV